MKKKNLLLLLFSFFTVLLLGQDRSKDPVVLTGQEVPCMLGIDPDLIVAFAYNNGWQQIPMQVDEVVVKDISAAYGPNDCIERSSEDVAWMVPYYADTNTDIGPDNDRSYDNNDELVFMAKDAANRAPNNACPNGVLSNTRCELTVRDPLNNSIWGYVYVFRQTGALDQAVGRNYVTYDYSYEGNYKSAYEVCVFNGTNNNPENTKLTTSEYQVEFSQRWVEDVLRITAGNANGTDILDRHQIFINAGACSRNEQVFSDGKGPIVTNIDGPVRAIRSVMGAKSGTFTEETIKFTQYRADYTIFYRLHTANGYNDIFDFSAAASGMRYHNDRTPSGVIINGNDDNVDTSQPNEWELITGVQGSLVTTFEYDTDITLGSLADFNAGRKQGYVSSYYSDRGANAEYTCTGDARSYGSCGFALDTKQCTDRRATFSDYPECRPQTVKFFTEYRTHYYLPPNASTNQAAQYGRFGRTPLTVSAQSTSCGGGNNPSCNDGIQNSDETGIDCGGSCPSCPVEPTCDDGIQNGDETGIDCGGSCPACPAEPTCDDGIQNGDETGIDCGGSCPACPVEPTCNDGIQNGDETGIDCGGSCPACPVEPSCETPTGLSSNNTGTSATLNWNPVAGAINYTAQLRPAGAVNWRTRTTTATNTVAAPLKNGRAYEWRVQANCADTDSDFSASQTFVAGETDPTEPTCNDGIQNGDETGIDCGGSCPACPVEPTCNDGIQNGDEIGIDCGGSCPACPVEPTCNDGIQNGDETGIDCGGSCPACPPEPNCAAPTGLFVTDNVGTTARLNWSPVQNATRYTVQVRATGSTTWNQGRTTRTNALARPLSSGTTYEWRVQANCGTELSDWSTIETFTAGQEIEGRSESLNTADEVLIRSILEATLFPSPATDWVTLKSNYVIQKVEIYDLTAQRILELETESKLINLNISELEAGTYFVRFQTKSESKTIKLSKM